MYFILRLIALAVMCGLYCLGEIPWQGMMLASVFGICCIGLLAITPPSKFAPPTECEQKMRMTLTSILQTSVCLFLFGCFEFLVS